MSTENEAMIQENLEEFILDENKIVTVRWLSLTLKLNINRAKQALYSFVELQRNKKENDEINVTYFVSGLGKNKDGLQSVKCVVVPETQLDVVKSSLDTITSCHLYSVQKSELKDYTPLYMTDYEAMKDNLDSIPESNHIKCPWAKVREQSTKLQVAPSLPKKEVVQEKKQETGKKESKPEPKGSIASMFSAGAKKAKEEKSSNKNNTNASKKVNNFFKKEADDSSENKPNKNVSERRKEISEEEKEDKNESTSKNANKKKKEDKNESTSENMNKKKKENREEKGENSLSKKKTKTPEVEKTKEEKKKDKQDKQKSESKPSKKRRRIQNRFSDSSEDEEGEQEIPDTPPPAEPEPEEEMEEEPEEKSPPKKEGKSLEINEVSGRKRKRTRKLVPKQYVDDDGFMVTEKVWESDSTDASEVEKEPDEKKKTEIKPTEPKVKKPTPTASTKTTKGKQTSPQKSKQTSLMSFFKKK